MKQFTKALPNPLPSNPQRPFDHWNSSSTGHQRREASRWETDGVSETDWRTSRSIKINNQFSNSTHRQPQRQSQLAQPLQRSVIDMLVKPGSMKESTSSSTTASLETPKSPSETNVDTLAPVAASRIFAGLVIYVNGSTYPLVSDHKLKTLLCEHGARLSLHLARRQVTHVILGRPARPSTASSVGNSSRFGCGGGLAGTKMDKEIRRVGGCGIKYVGVEWYVYIFLVLHSHIYICVCVNSY